MKLIEIGNYYPCKSEGTTVDLETTEAYPGDIIELYFESDYDITASEAHDVAMQIAKIKEDYPESVIHYFKVEGKRITIQYSIAPPSSPISSSAISSRISFVIPLWAGIAIVITLIIGAIFAVYALQRGYLLPHKLPRGNAVVVAKDRVDGRLLPNVKISSDGLQGTTGANGQGILFEGLLEGDHVFIGETIEDYDPPNPITAYITADKTANVTIPYNPEGVVPPTHGWLDVNTDPVKGIVFIDSVDKGKAPISSYEKIGEHSIAFGTIEDYITPEPRTVTVLGDPLRTHVIAYYTKGGAWWEKYLKYALIGGGVILGSALVIPPVIRALIERRGKQE
jgi:hypothetical protein